MDIRDDDEEQDSNSSQTELNESPTNVADLADLVEESTAASSSTAPSSEVASFVGATVGGGGGGLLSGATIAIGSIVWVERHDDDGELIWYRGNVTGSAEVSHCLNSCTTTATDFPCLLSYFYAFVCCPKGEEDVGVRLEDSSDVQMSRAKITTTPPHEGEDCFSSFTRAASPPSPPSAAASPPPPAPWSMSRRTKR